MTFAATTRLLNAFGQGFAQVNQRQSPTPARPCLLRAGIRIGELARELEMTPGARTDLTQEAPELSASGGTRLDGIADAGLSK